MSRIGKKPITVPAGVEVKIDGKVVTVKGPKGTLTREFNHDVDIKLDAGVLSVSVQDPNKDNLTGLSRTLLNNMIVGVTEGFQKELEVNGVGYRVQKQGKKLIMNMGFSHPVEFEDREGVTIEAPNPNSIIVKELIRKLLDNFVLRLEKLDHLSHIKVKVSNMLENILLEKKERWVKNKSNA